MAQQDDNIKKLYDELQSTYDVGSEDDFRNYLNNAEHRKALYNELKNDYDIQDEKAFDDYLGYINGEKAPGTTKVGSVAQQVVNEYDQSAKDNAEAEEDLSAATSGAKIGGNISFAPAKPNNQQTVQLDVDNTAKSVMDASGTPAEQAKVTGPKTQFVPADPNYVQATPTAEALKKYPWMQPDQVYLWNKTTKEPVVTYVDESGQAVTDEDLQIKKSKSEITGQEDTEYMHPEAAALQLPNGNTRGVRLKKGALTQMADEIMRKEYGDNYLNTQFGKDGNVYTGAERRDLGAQQLYDELNSDVRKARISFAVADDKDRNEILSRIKAKWGKVADETSLVNAVNDENAAKQDIDIVAQQNINDLNAEIQNISRQMDQRGAEIDNASSPFVDQTFNARDVDPKYRILQSKLNYAQNALKSWENVKNSSSLNAFSGFKDAIMDISAWDFGFSDLKNSIALLTAKGKDKQELVNLYGRSAEAAKFEDKYNPDSYRYGKIAGTSIPYALQFAGTDGGFKSIGSALSKKATSIAEKYALEGLKKQVVKGLGVAVGDIARAYTMSGTVQGLNTISDILTRSAGELTVDKQGNYQLKSDEPLLESIYKGVTASAIQNFTEMVGESVNISANLMRMLPKIGLGRVSNAITKIGTQDWYRVCNNWLSRAGVNDFGGEVLEEELSIILNAAFVGDNPLLNGSGGLLDVRTQKDILGGMLYSISAMRAGALAMYGVKKGVGSAFVKTLDMYDKMQLNQSDKGGQSIFGEGWTEIKDEIDNTPNDKVNAVIEKLAKEHPSKDEQSAIIDYAVKLLKTRGHNLGIAMASDGENDEGAQEEIKDMPDLSQPNAEYLNKDDGMIHKASLYPDASDPTGTAKDVFIIKGNLVTNEDGSINKDASDDTIIYIDGNGERHIASPDKFAAAYPPMSNNEVLQANEGGENEEAQTTTFNKGDEVNINVDGNNYTATIQGTDGFGNYNVYYEDEIGMMHPAKFTADQLNEMNGKSTVSNGQQATSEQPADVQQQVEQPVVEQPAQQEQETQLAQQAQEEQKSAIPKDEKGNALYHQVPVETTINDLYDGKLDDNEIRDFVDANISEADKNLEKINKKAPKIGINKAEYLKKKQEWQKQVEDATRISDYWNSVKDYIAKQTHTTPEEVKAAQDELSGEAARREYQDMGGSVQQDAVSVASDFIRGAKITPESFKAETGYGTDEQRKFVGMIAKAENGGKTIDRLAEELVSYDNAEMNGVLFGGDTSSAKDAILSALQGAGTRGELKQTNEAEEQAYIDARNAARDAQYMEQYGMTYEEYLAYEEQIMPTIWREYNNYDETAFNNMYAEEIEQLIKSRENDTTGEEQADDRGNQVLSEQQVTEQRGSAGSQEPGREIQAGVQGTDENAAAPEEAQQEVAQNDSDKAVREKLWKLVSFLNSQYGYNFEDEDSFAKWISKKKNNIKWLKDKLPSNLVREAVSTINDYIKLLTKPSTSSKISTAEPETNIASPEKDINKDDYIYITNTYNGLQGIGNLKEWSKKTGDVRTEPDGFGVYNGLSYFKKSYGGRGGDNVTVWFKNSPSQNVKENIEYLLDNSKNLLYFGDDLVKLIVNTKDDAIINKKISLAEAETDTNPTEGQKEAGNYKKGHVRIDGYDITIEQPKGSVRRGTDADGNIHDGILMPDKWNTSLLKSSGAPLSARMEQIKRYEPIVSSDGKVTLNGSQWAEMYYLTVPKTKKDGAMYYENKVLLDASKGEFYPYRGNLRADIPAENIEGVVKELTKLGVKVRESNDAVSRDTNINEEEANDLYREVTDKRLINKLENEPKVKVYRAMQLQDGKLLPPMSGKIKTIVKDKNGKERTKWVWREPTNIGKWEEAEERPDLANDDGTFTLNKGNNSLNAAYNPYIHTSRSPINDQFSSAWNRDELVTVEVEVPVSELTSGYRAEKAKDSVGEVEWKSGPVGRQLAKIGKPRLVILSRWDKPIRVIPVDEVAGEYAKRLEGTGIEVPFNTVTPELREALVKAGVKIGAPENNNAGKASLDAYNEWRNNNEIDRQGAGALTDSELSNANDPAGKMLGKPSRTPAQQKAFAERERQRMADRAREVADILHLDNVEIVTDASTLKGRRAKAKGFYSRDNGKIVIVVPNHVDMADIEQTVLHEAVAHYGLRKLFGSNFDTFLYNVYNNADMDVRDKIVKLAEGHNWDFATATEEYLASLAEKTNFENLNASWWDKIKSLFLKLLHSIGLKGFTGVSLSDNELRYILWRSYENLKNPGRYRSIIDEAKDITMQNELRVGNYSAGNSEAVGKAAENGVVNIEDVNRRFNEELGRLTEENAQSVILNLGRPGNFLLASGLSDRPIKLYGNKLLKKMRKHGFTTSDVKNLPKEINNPIAVFKGSVENSFAILTELEINGNNVLASISVGKGNDIDFNIISSVYGKNGNSVVSWINDGKILYVNKEKALNYLRISAPIAEAQDNQELSSAANIVKNFENPSVGEENILYREAKKVGKKINSDWRDEYDKKLSKFSFKLTEAAQDAMRSVKILQDIIAKETSAPIRDDENVYWRENRLSSVNKYEQEYYNENYCKPIVTEIANLVKYGARYNDKGEDIINSDNDVLKYLIAKSGLERNQSKREVEAMNARKPYEDQIKELQKQVEKEEIKEENANKKIAKLQEQADKAEMNKRVAVLHKDYSGLTELFQDEKDFDTLATSYVSDFEKKFDTESLWNAINRATKETLRKAFVDGLISRESYESTAKMYKYYIPLRGWANDVASEAYNYKGSGEGSRKILQTAKGRTSLADNPISEIGRMMQDAIFQGNRNRMKQAVYNLAMNHDTSLLNIKRQWYQNMGTEEDPAWERVFPDLNSDMTADQVAEEVEDFESRMRELKKEGKATQSRKGLILRLHTTKREEAQHRISVAINGKEYNIFVNGNPRAAQAINGELNDVDRYGSAVAKVNRFLSQVYTSINPEFVVTNYQRDAGFAASIVASTEPWSYQKEWAKNMTIYNPITTGAYLSSLIKKAKTGNINPNNKAERYMQEFLSHGGETGFTNMLSADDYKKQIKRDIKSINSVVSLSKASRAAVAFTERANTVFEDATRYATYVTSREQGRTIDRSIRDAKEISLNFNTRGADGLPGDGFIYRFFRGLRRWMIFVNPSIQGLNKAGMAFRNHPLRSSMMIAGLPTLLGYALPAIMRAVVGGGDGDDDDKNVVESYKDLPKWVRRTNIAIPIGGNNFVTIPLSYELRVSYGLGEMMWEYGEGMIDKDEVATETVSQLSDLLPISFSNGTVAQSISPSIARPLIDIIQNRNFYGKKIYNDSQFIEGYPEYMKAYAGTPKWLVKSTEVLNNVIPNLNAGVSDKYTPGVINVNPAIIDYLLSSYLGGLYNFPSKFGKTISMIWDEDMRDIQNVPILSRNWKNSQSGNPYNSGDRYKTYMKEYDLSKQRFNGYKKEAKNDVPEFLNSLKDLLNTPSGKRMLMIDAYKRGGLDKLNQRIRDIDAYDNERYEGEKDALTKKRDEVKEELINKLDSISDGTLDFVNGEWVRK